MDESGIDSYLHREYGYAPRGALVYDSVRGRKYARTGIIAAKMGKEILAPCSYNGTMNHKTFELWFEKHLIPELPAETVIVMDNASFHCKDKLYELAQKHNCYLIFLPAYSPEENPIEHFWAWLKEILKKVFPLFDSMYDALCAILGWWDIIHRN